MTAQDPILLAPAPLAVAAAPHVRPEEVTLPLVRRTRDRRAASSGRRATPSSPRRRSSTRTAARRVLRRRVGRARAVLRRQGLRLARAQLPRLDRVTATTFERLNHSDWGGGDTKDCLAAADFLRTLDWVDGEPPRDLRRELRLVPGALSVTDDAEHRFRCAVCKYGDCDLADHLGAGRPRRRPLLRREHARPPRRQPRGLRSRLARAPARRTSQVPLLVAHGERDERVSPKQSERARRRASRGSARPTSTSPTRPRRTASCARARRSTSTGGSSASSTGTCSVTRLVRSLDSRSGRAMILESRQAERRGSRETPEAARRCPARRRRSRSWPWRGPSAQDDEKVVLTVGLDRRRHAQPPRRRRGARLRGLEPPVRDADRQGGGRLRDDPRPRRVLGGSNDGQTYTYTLREGLKWSDGEPLTAEDVAYTVNRAREEEWLNYSSTTANLTAKATDDRTVVITLVGARSEAPDDGRLHRPQAHLREASTPRQHHASTRRTDGVGSGPFTLAECEARPVLADGGEPELLGRRAGDRRGRLPRLQQPATRWSPRSSRARSTPRTTSRRSRSSSSSRPRASSRSRASRAASTSSRSTAGPRERVEGIGNGHPALLGHRVPPGDRARDRQADDHRPGRRRHRHARHSRSARPPNPDWLPDLPDDEQFDVRPRQGEADPRRGRLQGHERRRRPRDARRRTTTSSPVYAVRTESQIAPPIAEFVSGWLNEIGIGTTLEADERRAS